MRHVYPSLSACACCGGKLHELGEDITESLERVPARWFVPQHVREKFSCNACDTITQPPAPSHPIARGRAGPVLLAEIAFAGFSALYEAGRSPGPILEAGCWAEPAKGPAMRSIVGWQAEGHWRRKFHELAKLQKAPIAMEAVTRIDAIFALERTINGMAPKERLAVRTETIAPLVDDLAAWLRRHRGTLSSKAETAKAMDYALKRWPAFTRFLGDGRICLTNNAAERAIRCIAVGRRNWTFAGSDAGGHRAAAFYTLIQTCTLNDVDPRAWLADILKRLPDHPAKRIHELLPWHWATDKATAHAA